MRSSTKRSFVMAGTVALTAAVLLMSPFARAADMLQFSYTGLNGNYFNNTLFFNIQSSTQGDVTKLDGGMATAHLDFASATASYNLTLHLSSITATTASSSGTLVMTDLDGDAFTANVNGNWVNNGSTADFAGALTNVQPKWCLGDNTFNGTSGSFPMSFSEPAPFTGPITARLMIGNSSNWFTSSSFFGVPGSAEAHVVSGGGGTAAAPVQITAWRSVRLHGAVGTQPVSLNPGATGNGSSGPTVESRGGGIQRVEVTFSGPVTLTATPNAGVSVVGHTTSYAGHSATLGVAVNYAPASVTLDGTNTVAINFNAGVLPDDSCYTLSLGPGTINEAMTGDTDCNVRSQYGDTTGDGLVTLSDAVATLPQTSKCATAALRFDLDLSGVISLSDALAAKARVASPAHQALCP